jgi:hypothetical protein
MPVQLELLAAVPESFVYLCHRYAGLRQCIGYTPIKSSCDVKGKDVTETVVSHSGSGVGPGVGPGAG